MNHKYGNQAMNFSSLLTRQQIAMGRVAAIAVAGNDMKNSLGEIPPDGTYKIPKSRETGLPCSAA
ncbi:MAG: hypothetical protein INF84_12835 [Roseomonas sp.]|nr:hypothetical protein [Roseomonas sp.]